MLGGFGIDGGAIGGMLGGAIGGGGGMLGGLGIAMSPPPPKDGIDGASNFGIDGMAGGGGGGGGASFGAAGAGGLGGASISGKLNFCGGKVVVGLWCKGCLKPQNPSRAGPSRPSCKLMAES